MIKKLLFNKIQKLISPNFSFYVFSSSERFRYLFCSFSCIFSLFSHSFVLVFLYCCCIFLFNILLVFLYFLPKIILFYLYFCHNIIFTLISPIILFSFFSISFNFIFLHNSIFVVIVLAIILFINKRDQLFILVKYYSKNTCE